MSARIVKARTGVALTELSHAEAREVGLLAANTCSLSVRRGDVVLDTDAKRRMFFVGVSRSSVLWLATEHTFVESCIGFDNVEKAHVLARFADRMRELAGEVRR